MAVYERKVIANDKSMLRECEPRRAAEQVISPEEETSYLRGIEYKSTGSMEIKSGDHELKATQYPGLDRSRFSKSLR